MQIDIFSCLYSKYKITKPIRLIKLDNLKILVGSDGTIETTNKNKIRKNGRKDNRGGKILKPCIDKDGYLRISLTNNGKRKSYYVHRLVARAYLKDYKNSMQVNHKDGNKKNNNFKNLEMVTLQENIRHSIINGLKPKLKRDSKGRFVGKEVMLNE